MSVHEAISEHSRKQNAHLVKFMELDELREQAIERAVGRCLAGEPFTVEEINRITARINEHAQHGISPTRVTVTVEMVEDFAKRSSKKS